MNWHEYFVYDPSVPSCLRWKVTSSNRAVAGSPAGAFKEGYYIVQANKQTEYAHRVVWEMHYRPLEKGEQIDHRDLNRSNNKIDNLRLATHSNNKWNEALQANNTSGYKGVWLHSISKKWYGEVNRHNTKYRVGPFESKDACANALQELRSELHGAFVNHG